MKHCRIIAESQNVAYLSHHRHKIENSQVPDKLLLLLFLLLDCIFILLSPMGILTLLSLQVYSMVKIMGYHKTVKTSSSNGQFLNVLLYMAMVLKKPCHYQSVFQSSAYQRIIQQAPNNRSFHKIPPLLNRYLSL